MQLVDIDPADYNPRAIDEDGLRALGTSVKEFGLVEPLVWNEKTGRLVGGHQRLKVLLEQGYEETEVVVVDLDENREKALNLQLNNPHAQGWFTDDVYDLVQTLAMTDLGELVNDLRLLDLADIYVVPELPPEIAGTTGQNEASKVKFTLTIEPTDADEIREILNEITDRLEGAVLREGSSI